MNDEQLTPEAIYQMVAEVGFRKHFHLGGMDATLALINLCPITSQSHVLEVGCASGKTACYLAQRYGCRVIGVDLVSLMIDRAQERAVETGVQDKVEFRVGDARNLPFEAERFDILIGEFITGLVDEKRQCLAEYLRVLRPGGTLALNEATWIQTPSDELLSYLTTIFGIQGEIPSAEGWVQLLEEIGFREITQQSFHPGSLSRIRDDIGDTLRVLPRVLMLYLRKPLFRQFIKASMSPPKELLDSFGYGLYNAVKPTW